MGDNESAHSPGKRTIWALLSSPKFTLRRQCITNIADLVDEVEVVGLNDCLPRRVLDIVTSLTVWVSALNW